MSQKNWINKTAGFDKRSKEEMDLYAFSKDIDYTNFTKDCLRWAKNGIQPKGFILPSSIRRKYLSSIRKRREEE